MPPSSPNQPAPTWALVVCTYRRADVLLRCLRAALRQTVPPIEVIVVDASPNWEQSRDRVMREIAADAPAVNWRYVKADIPSLPAQRNQGIALASADILFMIDDDSILYTDCAQEILKVYAADTNHRIAAVGAVPVPGEPPDGAGVPPQADPTEWASGDAHSSAPKRLRDRLRWWLSLPFDRGERSFLPYTGRWPTQSIPPECVHLGLQLARTLNGYRMTFRREVIAKVRFTALLAGSPPFEDIEATHRASQYGAIVNAPLARLCHLTWNAARLNQLAYSALWVTNAAVLHVLYGQDKPALRRIWRRRTAGAMWLHLLKDLLKRNWRFPEFRGIRRGRKLLDRIYAKTPGQLERWYPRVQSLIRRWRD
jgi:glycosyltransferase involved in cell wall biosynthesis